MIKVCLWARGLLVAWASAGAMLGWPLAQAETGQDHPEVARYPGATINQYDFKEYEEFRLILSKPLQRNNEWTADKTLPLEGRVTYIHYEVPKAASALQVFRNYQSALRRSGFSELFVCDRPCTQANLGAFANLMKASKHYLNYSTDNQFLAGQRGNTYVSLWVNDGGVFLHVVEKAALNDGLMEVRGESAMAKSLSQDGRVDVYGLLFDTGKSVLKNGSTPTLQELAKVLQDNPALKVEVVGHTDDVGDADSNQKLSEARAAAVADALVKTYAIEAARMVARGMGQNAPLGPNTTEAGRAKNRRVEIIAVQADTPSAPQAKPATTAQAPAPAPAPTPASPAPAAPEPKTSLMDSASKLMDAANRLKSLFGN